jgi:hypothetical protein
LKKKEIINQKLLTYDLETRNIIKDGQEILIPKLACIYHPKQTKSFLTIDHNNDHEAIIINSLSSLLSVKWNNHHVGIHNFSKFDAVFIIRNILKLISYKNITIV